MNWLKNWFLSLLPKVQKQPIIVPDEALPPPAPTPAPHVSLIPQFCLGLFSAEGGKNAAGYIHNNPGDLRHSAYTASLGATGATPEGFCIFPDMGTGIRATQQLVTDACNGKLIAYKPSMSIHEFVVVYADPSSAAACDNYVSILCQAVKKVATDPISQLL